MILWLYELRLLLRTRLAGFTLFLLIVLTSAALVSGILEVDRQRAEIAEIPSAQAEDIGAIAAWIDKDKDAGKAAYYSFHPTWDAPSPLAFAALGMRDVSPYIMRVRALGLEAQIYDGDVFNPQLALPGRFDFAFVLVFLAPLFVIILFHDLFSGEREAGRLTMLRAMPSRSGSGANGGLWVRRILLRFAMLAAALGLPFLIAALIEGVAAITILGVLDLMIAYLLFWTLLALAISRMGWSSITNAATLIACWIMLTLVLLTIAHVIINRVVPVDQGAEITLAQRENVNRAWDIPYNDTMRRFYAHHPRWSHSPPMTHKFHYKWYLAFHQLGDESVADKVYAYRHGLERRSELASKLGWILPSVGVQAALTHMAKTDLTAQLAYQDRIRSFHKRLREFYYDYLFNDRPFGRTDFNKAPKYRE